MKPRYVYHGWVNIKYVGADFKIIADYLSMPIEDVYMDFHFVLQVDNSHVNSECTINYEDATYSL